MSKTVDMTKGKPMGHILSFAFPLIITNIGQRLYSIADAAIVGRGAGVKALAAVGATEWCYWLILGTIIVLTQGFSTFISRSFGEKDYRTMNQTIATSVALCIFSAIILTVGGLFAAQPALKLLNTPSDIFGDATVYLMTMISGTVIVTAYNMAASILRALGDGKSPMIAMIIAAIVNVGLDCLFVLVFEWGVFGAALATLIAQLFSFLYCLIVVRKIEQVDLSSQIWKPDRKMMGQMIVFGLPVVAYSLVTSSGGIILQSSVNLQGSVFIAGYTATNKVYSLLEGSALAIGIACSTFVAQNYGAKFYDRVKQGVRACVKIVTIMAIAVAAFTLLFRKIILLLFLDANDVGGAESLDIAAHYLAIMAYSLLIAYFSHIFRNVLQAIGISKWSMVSGIAELIGRVLMAKAVILLIGRDALFFSEPVAWLGAMLGVLLPYFWYRKKFLKDKS